MPRISTVWTLCSYATTHKEVGMLFGKKEIILTVVAALCMVILIGANIAYSYGSAFLMRIFGENTTDFSSVENSQRLGDEMVQELCEEGFVLMKNENNALPLAENERKINFFGYGSSDAGFILQGAGSGTTSINAEASKHKKVTLLSAFEREGFEYNKDLNAVYTSYSTKDMDADNAELTLNEMPASYLTDSVIAQAKEFSDIAVITISRFGREERDAAEDYQKLNANEIATVEKVCANFGKVIVIINTGNRIECGFLDDDRIDAAFFVGMPGQSGALALPKLMKGSKTDEDGNEIKLSPSGRLSDTYNYNHMAYDPVAANRLPDKVPDGQVTYAEGIYIGYKWYETADHEGFFDDVITEYGKGYDGVVQYPFGYGLDYCDFEWEIQTAGISPAPNSDITDTSTEIMVSVKVTNVGDFPGKEVVQLYYTPPYGDETYEGSEIEKAYVNLLDFGKTRVLAKGESQTLTFTFTPYEMASYDCYDKNHNKYKYYEIDGGKYQIKFMKNAHTLADCANSVITFNVPDTLYIKRDPVTQKFVKNQFTGENAYMDMPIDGSTAGGTPMIYLSRADFKATFPSSRTPNRTDTAAISKVNKALYDGQDVTEMPLQGVRSDNPLRLVTKENGDAASLEDLNGKTGTKLVYNEQLVRELGKDYEHGSWDTLLNQITVEELCNLVESAGYKSIALESVGKPLFADADGPAGFHSVTGFSDSDADNWTSYPNEGVTGCTFNQQLAYNMGCSVGVEANETNIRGWYAPGLNFHRATNSGRYFEYYGEDAILIGKIGAEVIRGAKNSGLICYMKHYAVSEEGDNPENIRTWLSEQALRELYLKPFEICVKDGNANAVMNAFNCIGAVWAGACYPLNVTILRNEWGFRGVALTDWSYGRPYMNTEQALRGGNDVMLDPQGGYSRVSRTDPTSVNLSRNAVKNLLFAFCDTYNTAKEYQENGGDDKYKVNLDEVGVKEEAFSPIPILMIVGVNVLCAAGMGVCALFIVKGILKKRKARAG